MSAGFYTTPSSLRAVLRAVPPLHAEDSLERFVRVCRQCACSSLPILQNGKVVGIIHQSDVNILLQQPDVSKVELVLRHPVAEVMRFPEVVIPSGLTPEQARNLFIQNNLDLMCALPVVDEDGYALGVVVYNDLLTAEAPMSRPGSIGGMATPFGVYLTDGTVQAGAGNFALIVSGMIIGALLLFAANVTDYGLQWLQHVVHLPQGSDLLDVDDMGTRLPPVVGLLGFGLKMFTYLVFFGLMRATSLAGYHAAEHQTVHAIERNERLLPEIVCRMPRPHPRCGTNIMAIGLVLFSLCPLLVSLLRLDVESALLLSGLVTLFTWRRVGTFLQAVFTTRPASPRQIASGIAAARALLETYYTSAPVRPTLVRRIWCMGILQNMIGMLTVSGVYFLLTVAYAHFSHH